MKKLLLPVILIALIGGGGYAYYVYSQPDEAPQVIKATVGKGDIVQSVIATGTLDALRTVQVGSQVSGVVDHLYVDFNSIVHKDQVLATIDPQLLQSAVDQAQANLDKSKVDLELQKVQLLQNQHDQKRNEDLFQKNLVTQQVLEQAVLNTKTTEANIAAAVQGLVQLQANLTQAKTNLGYATIKSPIDGVVVNRIVDQGSTVQASMTTPQFFALASDLSQMKLTAGVDEADMGNINPGQTATFTVEAYPNETFTGKVDSVRLNSVVTSNVVTYQVVIIVLNPDLKLRPGMTANTKIQIFTAGNSVKVPNAALRFRPNADMYAALGLEAPQRGGGAGRGAGGAAGAAGAQGAAPAGAAQQNATPGAAPSAPTQMAQNTPAAGGGAPGQGGRGGNRQPGQGGGRGGNFASTLTPEQQKAYAEIQKLPQDQRAAAMAKAGISFGGRGGQGGGRGGNGGRGAANNTPQGPVMTATQRGTEAGITTIDLLYGAPRRAENRGQVWTASQDPTTKKWELKSIPLRTGITDGQWTEVVSGDVQPGQEIVTGVILPSKKPAAAPTSNNPLVPTTPQRGGPGGGGGFGGGGGRGGL
jgi:HlyD family secretion protein